MKRLILILMLLVLSGCAHLGPFEAVKVCAEVSGFWFGLWNGWTIFFSFVGSLFDDSIAIYDICNSGGWYDFGFWLGVGVACGSSGAAGSRR